MLDTHDIIYVLRLITGASQVDAAYTLPYYIYGPVYRPVMSLSNLHSTIDRAFCVSSEVKMANKYVRTGIYRPCRDCGTQVYLAPSKAQQGNNPLCSNCKQARSDALVDMSRARLVICEKCGKRFYWNNQGRKYCLDCTPHKLRGVEFNGTCVICGNPYKARDLNKKKTCSRTCLRVYRSRRQMGNMSHRWKGGLMRPEALLRGSMTYADWRTAVYERDDYTCQMCFERGGKLAAHHIREFAKYPELRLVIGNGITLCWPCHHSIKGKERIYETTFFDITGGI